METTSIQALGAGTLAPNATSNTALGKEDFLKLLVAQLSHQDPLKPAENTEFVAQLAQFSALEQLTNVNTNLGLLQVAQVSAANGQVAGLIGKEVEVRGDTLQTTNSGPTGINFELGGAAKNVVVKITDSQGRVIRTLDVGSRSAGLNSVTWDGKDTNGQLMPPGRYGVQVTAKDASGQGVEASLRFKGVVSGVTYSNGVPLLEVNGTTVQVGDVMAVRLPNTSPNP